MFIHIYVYIIICIPSDKFPFHGYPPHCHTAPYCVPSSAPPRGRSGGPSLRTKAEGILQHPAASGPSMMQSNAIPTVLSNLLG